MFTSAENVEAVDPDDINEVGATRHSKAAICPKYTLLSTGSDSKMGEAETKNINFKSIWQSK